MPKQNDAARSNDTTGNTRCGSSRAFDIVPAPRSGARGTGEAGAGGLEGAGGRERARSTDRRRPAGVGANLVTENFRQGGDLMATATADPKVAALVATRSLNPHPEKVTDAVFLASRFGDPRDVVQR